MAVHKDTIIPPQGEIDGDPRFVGHTSALKDLQEFVQSRQIPYLGQWYSRISLTYLGVQVTVNERVETWADDPRYLIREMHTHGAHASGAHGQTPQQRAGARGDDRQWWRA